MQIYVVRFAVRPGDKPINVILDEKKYDDWIQGEPQEGYHMFEILWQGNLDVAYTALNDLRAICHHTNRHETR